MDHEQYHLIESAFIHGFRTAPDKAAFLALARIPLELAGNHGPSLKLVEVILADAVEVGRASRGFASRELVYQPLPGKLVATRTKLTLRYISGDGVQDLTLADVLRHAGVELTEEGAHQHAGGGHRRRGQG